MIPYSSDSRRLSLLCLQARHQGAYGLNRVEIVGYDLDGGYLDVECIFELGHEGDHRQRIDAARIDEVDACLVSRCRAMRMFPETSRTTTDGRSRLKNSARPSVAQ